ncbi:MAG: hypothetical protein ABI418_11280, partial [Jatrophihabitantaceae bacterium]
MTEPQFHRSAGDQRLFWLDGAGWASTGGLGLVLFGASDGVPDVLSLSQSFTDYPGYYACLTARPEQQSETAFVQAVLALGQRLGPAARFLWLA